MSHKFDSSPWVGFVTLIEFDKERKIRVRCCEYISGPERLVARGQNGLCLMLFAYERILECHLNGAAREASQAICGILGHMRLPTWRSCHSARPRH